jgi:hypothetical protein
LLFVFQLSIVFRWFVLGECLLLPRVMILRYVIDVRYLFSSVDPYLMLYLVMLRWLLSYKKCPSAYFWRNMGNLYVWYPVLYMIWISMF